MRGESLEEVRLVAVNTTEHTNMFGDRNEVDWGAINLQRGRSSEIVTISGRSIGTIKLKFSFAGGKLNIILLAILKSKLEKEFEFVEIVRDKNTVVSLAYSSDMDFINFIK